MKHPGLCEHECYDEVLLDGLPEYLQRADRDLVVVLHQKGSHGPSYYLRYPKRFEVFGPVCRTNQLENCTPEEIVNPPRLAVAEADAEAHGRVYGPEMELSG